MIVVDTNILLYSTFQLSEPALAAKARALMIAEPRWILPGLWRHEYLNALCTYIRVGGLSTDEAWGYFAQALAAYSDHECPVEMNRALELSQQLGLSGYDAQFVALAEASNVLLITEDKRLLKAVGGRAMSMEQRLKH